MPIDFNLLQPSNLNMVGSYQQGVDTSNHNAQNGLQMQQELQQMRQRNLMGQQQQIATKIIQDNGGDVLKAAPQLSQISPEWAMKMQSITQQNATLNKPVWDSASGQFVTPPSSQNTNGQAVQPQGYTPSQKQSLELQGLQLGNQAKQAALTATKAPKFDSQTGGWIYPPDANNPNGRFIPMQQGQGAPGTVGNPTGDQFLATLDPPRAAQIKALAEGRMKFPAGFALKSPYWQQMISAVSQYDPSFDAVNYNSRAKTRGDFTSGQSANNIMALNTAIQHLGSLSDAFSNLDNSSMPAYNKVSNWMGNELGNSKIQSNYQAVSTDSTAVAHELAKVFRQSGMSEAEINDWQQKINPNSSPAQMQSTIKSAIDLMNGRLQALGARYNQGMGKTADPLQLLTPKAQQTLGRLSGGQETGSQQTASNIPPQAIDMLKQNPALSAQFEAKYGVGSAASVLGQ